MEKIKNLAIVLMLFMIIFDTLNLSKVYIFNKIELNFYLLTFY